MEPVESVVDGTERALETAEFSPVTIERRREPIPFEASDGRYHLLYELRIANVSPLELFPTEVEIRSPQGRVIERLDAEQTAEALWLPEARHGNERLGTAQVGLLFLALAFDAEDQIPDELVHTVTVEADDLPEGESTSAELAVRVNEEFAIPSLSPPLEPRAGYVVASGCCDSEAHIRAALTLGDQQWIAQRFAIDYVQLTESGAFLEGDPEDPASYRVYGDEALAAADGEVVSVIDDLEDQTPGELPGMQLGLREVGGNSLVIEIDDGLYMLYAHLQRGSIDVEEGDRVAQGDALGLVGNSGNSSAPHLHFHVMDGPSPLASSGVPYAIDSFEVTGRTPGEAGIAELENSRRRVPLQATPDEGPHEEQLPLGRAVVSFP